MVVSSAFVGVFLLISLVNGQVQDRPKPACKLNEVEAGNINMPHERYVQAFHVCNSAGESTEQWCPQGTVYSTRTSNCDYPYSAVNPNFPCTSGSATRYPTPCYDTYYECSGAGYALRNCTTPTGSTGMVFNSQTGQCASGPLVDQKGCYRPYNNQVDPRLNCTLLANPPNVCSFKQNTTTAQPQPCPVETEFSESSCGCVFSTRCYSSNNITKNKELDPQCRYSCYTNYNLEPGQATAVMVFSDKMAATPTPLPYNLQTVGVTASGGIATFSTNPNTGAQAYGYMAYYDSNELATPVCFTCSFRPSQAGSFQIISNQHQSTCVPTFEANATFTGSSLSVSLYVVGFTQISVNTQSRSSATTSATITAQTGEYVEFISCFDRSATLQLVNRGQSGAENRQVITGNPTPILGDKLAPNNCGFRIGYGLNGQMDRFGIAEGCADTTKLRAQ